MADQVEKVVIVGSGPAGWAAAIYAARAKLNPLVYEGAVTEKNRMQGTSPLGQLALTTEVENFPGFPAGELRQYLKTALPEELQPYWVQKDKPARSHGIEGPELMELMRQQAKNFGTRVITDDIVKVDFKKKPFELYSLEGQTVKALTVIIATGRGPIISACRRKTSSRTAACRPAPYATGHCRDFATSRWSSSAEATRPSKKPAT